MRERLYAKYGKKTVHFVAIGLVGLIAVIIYLVFFGAKTEEVAVEDKTAQVTVKSVRDIVSNNSFSTIGVVKAVSEAQLQTEAGGRITSVNVELGQKVYAGTILASIENSAERAVLLQAEGAYEAAKAQAQASEIGLGVAQSQLASAQTSGLNTYQDAFIGVDGLLHTTLDEFFTMSNNKAIGFRLNGKGQALQLNNERTLLETQFESWKLEKATVSKATIGTALNTARTQTTQLAELIEKLTLVAQDQDLSPDYSQTQKDADVAVFFAARVTVNSILKQIEGASTAIKSAEKVYQQSEVTGSDSDASASSAQVKIALGALRGAQANYEKTLVRTPITGVVNALYLKAGEYASPSQKAAIVANNNGLEISSSVSIDDSSTLTVGDEVRIGESATGTITAIAGAIDPTTNKVAIKVSVNEGSDLNNGSTVTLLFAQKTSDVLTDIIIPLSALKMTGSGPIAFSVNADNKLESHKLILGTITGDSVVVTEGLTQDSMIVTDARGLKEGQEVTVTTN